MAVRVASDDAHETKPMAIVATFALDRQSGID